MVEVRGRLFTPSLADVPSTAHTHSPSQLGSLQGTRFFHGPGLTNSEIGMLFEFLVLLKFSEMYMNCAYLKVVGSPSSYTAPKMFVANTGQCTTTEGVELAFPNPGANVEYGGGYAGQINVPATSDCASVNNFDVTIVGSTSTGGNSSGSSGSSSSSTSTSSSISTGMSTISTVTASSSSTSASTTTDSSICNTGAIQCSSDGLSWSVCVNGNFVSIGAVSSGTKCVNGAIICASDSNPATLSTTTSPAGPIGSNTSGTPKATTTMSSSGGPGSSSGCTSGAIKCAVDGKSWSMCSNGAYIFMGAVAPGMSTIVLL